MKVSYSRRHVTRPEDYEAVELRAHVEVDLDADPDKEDFDGLEYQEIGEKLSQIVDALLDTDIDRALGLGAKYTNDSHLWVFYEKD